MSVIKEACKFIPVLNYIIEHYAMKAYGAVDV
jgi:hypothetical protein